MNNQTLNNHYAQKLISTFLDLTKNAKAYLEPSGTSTIELFCENGYQLKQFSQKSSIFDVLFLFEIFRIRIL